MPIQIFKIIRAHEHKPIDPEDIERWLWVTYPKSEWKVEEKIDTKCTWIDEGEYWHTQCGNDFVFNSDGPEENSFRFCPYCGDRINQN